MPSATRSRDALARVAARRLARRDNAGGMAHAPMPGNDPHNAPAHERLS